ncbi:hypothetical protein LVD15_20770 [Fulvivirga maritima]|uniref:hypothetical protein n=1 Tax=Fulvivirga maritima TaxID=2904247 RepID=UPI001F2E201D|nr:hypothetical protein [Fulvivirga maritima]UII25716.1 hypothetical protein LVD15_20770 [Fulvivirga maritima]
MFLSIWCLYAISGKVEYVKTGLTLILSKNSRAATIGSLLLFAVSVVLLCLSYGLVAGIFSALVLWMTLASSIVLLAPAQRIKWFHIVIFLMATGTLEVLYF